MAIGGVVSQCARVKKSVQSFRNFRGIEDLPWPLLLNRGANLRVSLLIAGQFCWAPVKVRNCSVIWFFSFDVPPKSIS